MSKCAAKFSKESEQLELNANVTKQPIITILLRLLTELKKARTPRIYGLLEGEKFLIN